MKQELTLEEFAKEPLKVRVAWQDWASVREYPPRPKIGTMIDFLDENITKSETLGHGEWGTGPDGYFDFSYQGELCDFLWSAVKEVLTHKPI